MSCETIMLSRMVKDLSYILDKYGDQKVYRKGYNGELSFIEHVEFYERVVCIDEDVKRETKVKI